MSEERQVVLDPRRLAGFYCVFCGASVEVDVDAGIARHHPEYACPLFHEHDRSLYVTLGRQRFGDTAPAAKLETDMALDEAARDLREMAEEARDERSTARGPRVRLMLGHLWATTIAVLDDRDRLLAISALPTPTKEEVIPDLTDEEAIALQDIGKAMVWQYLALAERGLVEYVQTWGGSKHALTELGQRALARWREKR